MKTSTILIIIAAILFYEYSKNSNVSTIASQINPSTVPDIGVLTGATTQT